CFQFYSSIVSNSILQLFPMRGVTDWSHQFKDNICIVYFEGIFVDLDLVVFQINLAKLMNKQKSKAVLFNLKNVTKVDSSGITKFIILYRSLTAQQIHSAMCQPHENIQFAFEVVRLNEILPLYDTEEEAITFLNKHPLLQN
ncbi:MAG: STAS domain-containing protein, partial [SAR324 cluster bacterium]|nr:STAS domain-containing protein [SAR324 cluster bacterium]